MIFLDLFLVFSKIGILNFGGGYAMLSLIQNEIVVQHEWLSTSEFTDIVAVSQMTPGPIGINAATYVGYTAVVQAGYPPLMGVLGSLIATISVLWLPFLLMLVVSRYLMRLKDHPHCIAIFSALRPAVVGLIAVAALLLMTEENFGSPTSSREQFVASLILFALSFIAVYRYKLNPLMIISVSGVVGVVLYGWIL